MIAVLKNKYFPWLFTIPLFFCVRHYNGIVMDAILYITQYVHSIDPTRFLSDPAFEFGNQGELGCFSLFLGYFLEFLGVNQGAFIYTFLMQFLWIFLAICLIKSIGNLLKSQLWVLPLSILFVVFFAHGMTFSSIRFFQYIESYACSRSLSMVFGLGGLVLLLKQKKTTSLLLFFVGTIVHPITAGWCLPAWLIFFFPKIRIPIAIFSLLLPLSGFLHYGKFDFFPNDWLSRPLSFAPCYESIGRFVVLFSFFTFVVRRFSEKKEILNLSRALSFLLIIALYWDFCGGYGEHIFLYQVQPWRILWMPSVVAVPLGLFFIKDAIRRILKCKRVSTYDFALFMLIASFLMPINFVTISIASAYLLTKSPSFVTKKDFIIVFSFFIVTGIAIQQYHGWSLQGFPSFLGYNFFTIEKIRNSILLYQLLFIICLSILFFRKKNYVPIALLLFYLFFPKFMVAPFFALFFAFAPRRRKKIFVLGGILTGLIVLADGLLESETRFFKITNGMPQNFIWICFSTVISFGIILLPKKLMSVCFGIWLLFCCLFAGFKYDNRTQEKKKAETQLNEYLHTSIFPQIAERGRTLFVVSGTYENEPRLRFLTGSYYTNCGHSGEIFNKDHYKEMMRRGALLFSGNQNSLDRYIEYDKILIKLKNKDSLINRTLFLCSINEITHLVTDVSTVPLIKEDSTMIDDFQMIYLYGCLSTK